MTTLTRVRVVVDHADTMSVKSLTTLTLCLCSQQLRGHRVGVVVDYADTMSAKSASATVHSVQTHVFREYLSGKCQKSCDTVPLNSKF